MKIVVYLIFSLLILGLCSVAHGEEFSSKDEAIKKSEISIDFSDEPMRESEDSNFFSAPLEQLFKNPTFVSGLASGAEAVNRSVESLMDALFYGLLDNEFKFKLTNNWWFSTSVRRDVFSAPNGSYVVVDRIILGPRYARELWRAHDIPVSLGIDGSLELLEIYLRTDGMRLAEQKLLPSWRRWINNWFGILPLLTAILPPSFNQNELYDPVRELQGPVSLPLTSNAFYDMPIGSIRSYGLTGGVNLPLEFSGNLPDDIGHAVNELGGIRHSIPYEIFKRGDHRINVLRRSHDVAWVGLKEVDRTGHKLSPLFGDTRYIFSGALAARIQKWKWFFGGVPVALFPLDLEVEKAVAKVFDQVYEYDMRNPLARSAYEAAVKGDFFVSRLRHVERVEKKLDTGVKFHFIRTQDRQESSLHNTSNFAVVRKERLRDRFAGEVEVTDAEGKFYVLETQQDISDKNWDIFVGEEETRVRTSVELKVRKVKSTNNVDDENQIYYVFEATPDPIRLTFSMGINDRFVNAAEYKEYIEQIRFFSKMSLSEVPDLPLRDKQKIDLSWRKAYFAEPAQEVKALHVTPQHLGGFGAQALISFSTDQIERIINMPEDDMWRSYARAFDVDPARWAVASDRTSLKHQIKWFGAFFVYPLKLFHINIPELDVISEAENGVRQLIEMRQFREPAKRLESFHKLIDSDHPARVARALIDLAIDSQVSRSVHFTVHPKGSSSQETKTTYGSLNNKIFRLGPPFHGMGRYQRAQQKIAAFYLDQPHDLDDKPKISRIIVTTRTVPDSLRSMPYSENAAAIDRRGQVFVTLSCQDITNESPIKLFIRVEQAGKVKLGKLHLAEEVIELMPSNSVQEVDSRKSLYEFYLTGPLSPISNFLFDESVRSGDQLLVTLAVSSNGYIWSPERHIEFRFERGILVKPE